MIEILMAVYNAQQYLSAQIDSILAQTDAGWHLMIQDDCSTDETERVAREYARKYPDKICFVRREHNSGGAKQNFISLLAACDAPYCMTCDQDDVWEPDKVALTRAKMQRMEQRYGVDTPLLVHTDLMVVNAALEPLYPSLFAYQKLSSTHYSLRHLLVQNMVTGCTIMVNRALLRGLGEFPEACIMHDWWLALYAAAFGEIAFIDRPTVRYRQHAANQVGAKNVHNPIYLWRRLTNAGQARQVIAQTYAQAHAFLDCYGGRMDPQTWAVVAAYARIAGKPKPARVIALLRGGYWKNTAARILGQLLFA